MAVAALDPVEREAKAYSQYLVSCWPTRGGSPNGVANGTEGGVSLGGRETEPGQIRQLFADYTSCNDYG